MNIDELLEKVKNWKPTEEQIKAMQKRMDAFDAKLVEEAKRSRITQEWLNREYTI